MPRLATIILALLATTAPASQHVALLVGDDTLAPELEALGYRTSTTGLEPEKFLLRAIGSWADTTPTNGTAVVYLPAPAEDKPYPLDKIAELLHTRGGSTRNIIATPAAPPGIELPESCTLTGPETSDLSPATPAIHTVSPPDRFRPGTRPGDHWINSNGMVFVWCPPGAFTAGSPPGTPGRYPDEEPRSVEVSDGFWFGKYELTLSQNLRGRPNKTIATQKNHPVNNLHWDDGRAMLGNFTRAEREAGRLPDGWEYAMPTSDQWEYAARAGTTSRFYFGDDTNALPRHANFADKTYYGTGDIYSNHAHRTLSDGYPALAPVGSFAPNPWGVHDVYGNVYEWCSDKSARGGAFVTVAENCRSAYIDHYASRDQQPYLGYRLVIRKTE